MLESLPVIKEVYWKEVLQKGYLPNAMHVRNTNSQQILICSPDTDVYHIGLPLQPTQEKQVIVQISAMNSRKLQLLHPNHLILALTNDPDLGNDSAKGTADTLRYHRLWLHLIL